VGQSRGVIAGVETDGGNVLCAQPPTQLVKDPSLALLVFSVTEISCFGLQIMSKRWHAECGDSASVPVSAFVAVLA